MWRAVALGFALTITTSSAWADAARDCVQEQDLDRSIRGCTTFIRQNPANKTDLATAYYNRGQNYRVKGDYDLAMLDYTKAIELNPRNAEAWYGRGLLHGSKFEADSAIRDFGKAIELQPRHADAHYNRGIVHGYKHEFRGALRDFIKAIKFGKRDAEAYNMRAHVEEVLGLSAIALRSYRKALQLDPANTTSLEGLERLEASH